MWNKNNPFKHKSCIKLLESIRYTQVMVAEASSSRLGNHQADIKELATYHTSLPESKSGT